MEHVQVTRWTLERLDDRCLMVLFGRDVSFGSGRFADVPGDHVLLPPPDGKLFAVGHRLTPRGDDQTDLQTLVASRLNADGTPDGSFHGDGSVELSNGGLATLAGSRLWVLTEPVGTRRVPILHAYTPELLPDRSFSGDG